MNSTRYYCPAARSIHCDRGKGRPKRVKCRNCGTRLYIVSGRYGVFQWTGKNDYRADDALEWFRDELAAERFATELGGDTHTVKFMGSLVS